VSERLREGERQREHGASHELRCWMRRFDPSVGRVSR
jgi:hypothetical protein